MKNLLLFALFSILFMSCSGGSGEQPSDLITWGTAFKHCLSTVSYWVFLLLALGLLGYVSIASAKKYKSADIDGFGITWRILLAIVVLACCLLIRPSEIAANTTVEQAARGAWIGY